MTYDPTTWVDDAIPCISAANLNNMEDGIDRAQGDIMVLRGLLAALPATDPLLVGRLYFATDTSELFRDNGAGWDQVYFDHGDLIGLGDNDHPQYIEDAEFAALGDILVGTGAATFANLGIGGAGQVLTVAGGTATWAAAAGGAWTLIAETILGAPAATVTFAAIPGTYRAIALLSQIRTDRVAEHDVANWRANGDAGNNYDTGYVLDGVPAGTVATNSAWLAFCEGANARANCFSIAQTMWLGYAIAGRERYSMTFAHGRLGDRSILGDIELAITTGAWRNPNAITSLTYIPNIGANFDTGCYFALYGIT